MSDPVLNSEHSAPRPLEQVVALRIQGRQALGNMLAAISQWEGAARGLGELGFSEQGEILRHHLQECYGIVGNLLGALAPWKDPQGPPVGLLVPEEEVDPEIEAAEAELAKVAANA